MLLSPTLLIVFSIAAVAIAGGAIWLVLKRRNRKPLPHPDDDDDAALPPSILLRRDRMPMPSAPPIRPVAPSTPAAPPPTPPQLQPQPRHVVAPPANESDGLVQLLPGRLEPLDDRLQQEIRFVKTAGVERFTLGRSSGPVNSHVQLSAPTTSRMHAYITIKNGRWRIGNLSKSNRVIVNGVTLDDGNAERLLEDGDRIELGELGFVFRQQ